MKKTTIIAALAACILFISCFTACQDFSFDDVSNMMQAATMQDAENAAQSGGNTEEEQRQPTKDDAGAANANDTAEEQSDENTGISGSETIGQEETTDCPGVMALTFDDGPSKEYTPILLDGLKERDIRATFFVLGVRAQANPIIIERANADGHVICSHGYDHKEQFTKLSADGLAKQLDTTAEIIYQITESYPLYVRPPYGSMNAATAALIKQPMMLWTIDPRDWDVQDANIVCQNIVSAAHDGAVILLHDIYSTSVEGAFLAIDQLAAEGWKFVTLPELYKYLEITPEAGKVYRGANLATLK